MFTIVDPPAEFEALNERCRELIAEILDRVTVTPDTFKLRSTIPLYDSEDPKRYIYHLKDGILSYVHRDRTLFHFQEGDLIGFERELDFFKPTIASDFATVLDRYPADEFLAAVHGDADLSKRWHEFVGHYIAALYLVARSLFKDSQPVLPEVRNYSAGSTIIEQGAVSNEIFTMADGCADIMKDGELAGTIASDGTFGLFSAFTGTPLPASVVATTDCLVLSVSQESYIELLLSRPGVVKDLLIGMAELVVEGGKQLAGSTLKL